MTLSCAMSCDGQPEMTTHVATICATSCLLEIKSLQRTDNTIGYTYIILCWLPPVWPSFHIAVWHTEYRDMLENTFLFYSNNEQTRA